MEFEQLVFQSEMLESQNKSHYDDSMIFSAFTAWLQGAGGKLNFNEFARKLKLIKSEKLSEESRDVILKKASETTAKIKAYNKKMGIK